METPAAGTGPAPSGTGQRLTGPDLAGRRALVTGAGSGIGAAVAVRLADLGAGVVVADIDADRAGAVADRIGGEPWVVDLSDVDALAELRLDVDILVNNAGVQHVSPVHEFPPERFALIVRLMLQAPFLLTRAALPHMYAAGWGRVVHVSSAHGLRASPFKSAYVAAKHGLEGLSKVVALEGAEHGVTSNCVNPGYVRTPLVEKQITDQARVHDLSEERVVGEVLLKNSAIKRLIEPDEVAAAVSYLCSPEASYMTGANLVLDGGWSAR
ncbi:3-hydroxybutyrate dehydrogenase [Nocardioides gansuensis]|uniref:3-hydroxybutyrate dehydrogenase n=1 Tax=Nocardioides gansuensis TaxID=2138300 RepID=A0A2T8FF64_9ACTN|nr:3-hydroxybutyrate dehydrogenase [Nocardioides gansuensis]PVG84330.1 3-hydroxybutyrate dehydrogenase [Nocardioides gansuensis]